MMKATIKLVGIVVILMALAVPVSARTSGGTATDPVGQIGDRPSLPDAVPVLVDWYEDWDSYPTGQDMHGVGGWKGWGDDPTWTAYTTDVQARSVPNSIDINGNADLVHEYSGYDDGVWIYTAWQHVPANLVGMSYFILLNQYDDPGMNLNWSTQVAFDSASGLVINEGPAGGTLPMIYDDWVEIRVEIDLDNDWQEFYYGGNLLFADSWADGMSGGGITSIGAVDLFANGASQVYYDDLSLVAPAENTMHVENIVGRLNFPFLLMKVQVADQDGMPLGHVLVNTTITMPTLEWERWRYTRPSGWARFWAPLGANGNYEICVDNLTLAGYAYNPDDNVYTCMDWDY
jgi:hypothetical protein